MYILESNWIFQLVLQNRHDKSEIEFPIHKNLSLQSPGTDIAVEVPVKGQDWPGKNSMHC